MSKLFDDNNSIQINGKLSQQDLENLKTSLVRAVALASHLVDFHDSKLSELRFAKVSATQIVNNLMMALSARCTKRNPPADLEIITDPSGKLVYRCLHFPAHEWDLEGNPLP